MNLLIQTKSRNNPYIGFTAHSGGPKEFLEYESSKNFSKNNFKSHNWAESSNENIWKYRPMKIDF